MRSVKSEIYLFVRALILGGEYSDNGTITEYAGVEDIKTFMFWNSELNTSEKKDNYVVPAVFFEYSQNDVERFYQNTNVSNTRAGAIEKSNITLHLITPKIDADREEDYLRQLDLAQAIFNAVQDKNTSFIQKLSKSYEIYDNDSSVLMDYQITFEVIYMNCGDTDLVDANDTQVNVNAPVELDVTVNVGN